MIEGILLMTDEYSEGQVFSVGMGGWLFLIRQHSELCGDKSPGEEGWPGSPGLLVALHK